eukprot:jgi/Botrbrau1/22825/Bobra.0132s0148.1
MQVQRGACRYCLSNRPTTAVLKPTILPSDQRLPRTRSGSSLLTPVSSQEALCTMPSDSLVMESVSAPVVDGSLSANTDTSLQTCLAHDAERPVPRTLQEAFWVFLTSGPPLFTFGALLVSLWWRSQAPYSMVDLAVAGGTAMWWLVQEYVLHAKFLHSTIPWFGREIHDSHHNKEYFHVSIEGFPLVIFVLLLAIGVTFGLFGSGPTARTFLSSYIAMGLTYQWTHYLVHTHVPARNPIYRTIRQNHMRHPLPQRRLLVRLLPACTG